MTTTPQFPGVARLRPRPLRVRPRLGRDLLVQVRPRFPRALPRRHGADARLGPAAAGGDLRRFGLYRGLWRFASVLDLQRIVFAAGLGALLIPVVLVMLRVQAVVPRSVLIFYPIVLIFLMAGDRFAYRIWKEHRLYSPLAALGEPVLVIGAGEAGARLTREFTRSRQWRVVGLIDDDPAKRGRLLHGVSVLGPISSLPAWAKKYGVRQVIVALPSAAHGVRRRVAEICADAGIEVLTVPSYEDLISGRSALTTIRTIELDDLLGRDPVVLDNAGLGRMARQPRGDGHRRRRLDRRRALPAHRPFPSREARAVRPVGGRGLCDPDRARRRLSAAAAGDGRGRRQARGAGRAGSRPRAAERHLPRRRLQARAADGGDQRVAGGAQQRLRHLGAWPRPPSPPRSRSSSSCRRTRRSTRRTSWARRNALPRSSAAACKARPRSSCSCASATCSAAPAASFRDSASRSAAAAR